MTTPSSATVGQFTVSPTAGIQAAATTIAATTQSDPQTSNLVPALRQATVVSYNAGTPPTCTVTFDGVTNIAGIGYFGSYFPVAGDIVACILVGGSTWILGDVASYPRTPVEDTVATTEGTTSSSYTDLATSGPTVTVNLKAGQSAMVSVSVITWAASIGFFAFAGYEVTGVENDSADGSDAAYLKIGATLNDTMVTRQSIYTSTAAGAHTFTMKYKSDGTHNPQFGNRRIIVVPFT